MTEKTWLDFFALCRYAIDHAVPIITAVGTSVAALASYRAMVLGSSNRAHLGKQDASIAQVEKKVDGQMTAFTDVTKQHTDQLAEVVKGRSDELAEVVKGESDRNEVALRAEIARLNALLVVGTTASASFPASPSPKPPHAS